MFERDSLIARLQICLISVVYEYRDAAHLSGRFSMKVISFKCAKND